MMYLLKYSVVRAKFTCGGGFVGFGEGFQYSSHVGGIAPVSQLLLQTVEVQRSTFQIKIHHPPPSFDLGSLKFRQQEAKNLHAI
jgi:hypothetical protein